MILIVATDTQVVLGTCTPDHTMPVMSHTYTLERNELYSLWLFNSSWLKAHIAQYAHAPTTCAKTSVAVALGSTHLQEFWQQTRPSLPPEIDTTYYLQEQPVFDKNYYALLRYDQILQYHLVCLPAHTLVCLTTVSIAWYYAYRLYYPTTTIPADTLTQLQQVLCSPEYVQQAGTTCPLVYACRGLAHLARYYTT